MFFKSTRSKNEIISTMALLKGIADDGGLFVPIEIPKIKLDKVEKYNYEELCHEILGKFLDIDEDRLKTAIGKAYKKFETKEVVPLKIINRVAFIELFHGPTLAFKDVALTLLPHLLIEARKIENHKEKIMILVATSGDTGSAALEGFRDLEEIGIIAIYPKKGISLVQRLQMTTNNSKNVKVCEIDGNFDDAQRAVKEIFANADFKKTIEENNYSLSSANSINIGRLIPQIVYYFSSYIKLLSENKIKNDEKIDVIVPTGNFGNILAAYYAKEMGLPIDKLISASNKNSIISDFINTGIYDTNREFFVTSSPSMDILISSNLERLLYHKLGEQKVVELMDNLKKTGKFSVDKSEFYDFYGDWVSEEETKEEIKKVYEESNYLIDPHTAVASLVGRKYKEKEASENFQLIAATASPFKFPKTIKEALNFKADGDDFVVIDKISEITKTEKPDIINKIQNEKENFKKIVTVQDLKDIIKEKVKGEKGIDKS